MNIKHFKADMLLENEQIKIIINLIDELDKKINIPSDSIKRYLMLYGSDNVSNTSHNFILDYEIQNINFPGYEFSLFSITGIKVEDKWEFFLTTLDEDDIFTEELEDIHSIICKIIQTQTISTVLEEIYDLDFEIQLENEDVVLYEEERTYKQNNKALKKYDLNKILGNLHKPLINPSIGRSLPSRYSPVYLRGVNSNVTANYINKYPANFQIRSLNGEDFEVVIEVSKQFEAKVSPKRSKKGNQNINTRKTTLL
ncbi:hypothetical protein AA0X95_16665 [Bacillus sp. 1P10SD]|uniref:hypothetical protein n=1 Tax=Bacillus sp. 1P10SD TaxID=3132265 RepID=UPI0039A4E715